MEKLARAYRRRLPATAVVSVALILAFFPAPVANAQPRDVQFSVVADATPHDSNFLGSLVVDSSTHSVYIVDNIAHSVEVYDAEGGGLVPTASLGPFGTTGQLLIDPASKRLFVADLRSGAISVVDVDPGSPRRNSVIDTLRMPSAAPGLSVGADRLAFDSARGRLLAIRVSDQSLTTFDIGMSTQRITHLPKSPTDIAVDPETGNVYVSSYNDKGIVMITASGTVSLTPVDVKVGRLDLVDGTVIAVTGNSVGATLSRFDPVSWHVVEQSEALGAEPIKLVVDGSRHLAYVSFSSNPTIRLLRSDSLQPEDDPVTDLAQPNLAVDTVSHRFFAADGAFLSGAAKSHLRAYDVTVDPMPSVDRLGGADRYSASAAISADTFSPGADVAYIASGQNFPDALSGAAAAGFRGGPVLLVTSDGVPAPVALELTRLKPKKIVVLGGTATIADSVMTALASYGAPVVRIGGADRFAVSAAISADTFSPGVQTAYLASGADFPDALSASAAAGRHGAPVLLVSKGAVAPVVLAELSRLRPQEVVVTGGPSTISDAVLSDLRSRGFSVERISGADRFDGSAELSKRVFSPPTSTVYVASGAVFPDALSGSAAAITEHAPVLLISRDAIPESVQHELTRLKPYRIVVLGGPLTISDATAAQLRSYLPQ